MLQARAQQIDNDAHSDSYDSSGVENDAVKPIIYSAPSNSILIPRAELFASGSDSESDLRPEFTDIKGPQPTLREAMHNGQSALPTMFRLGLKRSCADAIA